MTLCVWLWLCGPLITPSQTNPGLVLQPAAIDFGEIAAFSHHEQTIQVSNRTRQPVRVLTCESDCTCLAGRIDAPGLAAQADGSWKIELDPCDSVGEVRRSVWLLVDGQKHIVPVRYVVRPAAFADPEFVSLGFLGPTGIEAETLIRTLRDEPVQLLSLTSTDDRIHATLLDDTTSRTRPARVRIQVDGTVPAGELSGEIFVETAGEDTPRIRIPVLGEAGTGIQCPARQIEWPAIPLGQAQSTELVLQAGADTHVTGVRSSNDAVDVTRIERRPGRVLLTLATNPQRPLGSFHGHLVIEARVNDQDRKLRLPFQGRVVIPKNDPGNLAQTAKIKQP